MPSDKPAEALRFPVLTVSKRGEIEIVDDADRLQTGNAVALRNGFFVNQLIIEPTGQSYRVSAAKIRGPKGKWRGFRFMKPRLYSLELALSEESLLSLQEVQELVLAAVQRRNRLWAGSELRELQNRIRRSV